MKKTVALLTALLTVFTVCMSVGSAQTEEETLYEIFDDRVFYADFYLRQFKFGEDPDPEALLNFATNAFEWDDEYAIEKDTASSYWTDENGVKHVTYWKFAVPSKLVEDALSDFFVLTSKQIDAMHSLEAYDKSTDKYTIELFGGMGGIQHIDYGYSKDGDGNYTLYYFTADVDPYTPTDTDALFRDYCVNGTYFKILGTYKIVLNPEFKFLAYENVDYSDLPSTEALIRRPNKINEWGYFEESSSYFRFWSDDILLPTDTVVDMHELKADGFKSMFSDAEVIFAFKTDYILNGKNITPDGDACLVFDYPDDFDAAKEEYALYMIGDDGKAVKLDSISACEDDSYRCGVYRIKDANKQYVMVKSNAAFSQKTLTLIEGYAKGIKAGVAAGDVPFYVSKNGVPLADGDIIGTGCTVKVDAGYAYVAVVDGDTSGDGIINSTDCMQVRRCFLSAYEMNAAQESAADTSGDGVINSTDFMQIRRHFLNLYDIYAKG